MLRFLLSLLLFPLYLFLALTHLLYDSFNDSFAYLSRSRNVMTPSVSDSLPYYDSHRTVYKLIYYFCNGS